jgi:hypothetical protein
MAAKKIFSGVARIISPQFHSRKIPSLGGLRTDPDAFPSRSLHQVHCRNGYQLSILLHIILQQQRLPLFGLRLAGFPSFEYQRIPTWSRAIGVYQEIPLCRGVPNTTLESEVNTFDQRRFGAPHCDFVRPWS